MGSIDKMIIWAGPEGVAGFGRSRMNATARRTEWIADTAPASKSVLLLRILFSSTLWDIAFHTLWQFIRLERPRGSVCRTLTLGLVWLSLSTSAFGASDRPLIE
ncbi:MAG: hypothetical protein IH919_06875, partial [Deltaproteobacteria bacterium]|nr:hypothetical protein [Deltaproteobacteria bacterium]